MTRVVDVEPTSGTCCLRGEAVRTSAAQAVVDIALGVRKGDGGGKGKKETNERNQAFVLLEASHIATWCN